MNRCWWCGSTTNILDYAKLEIATVVQRIPQCRDTMACRERQRELVYRAYETAKS